MKVLFGEVTMSFYGFPVRLGVLQFFVGIGAFVLAGCGVMSVTIEDDALPDSKGEFYTIVTVARSTTHSRQDKDGKWEVVQNFPTTLDLRAEQGFAKCMIPNIASASPKTRFLHEKWLYEAVPDLHPSTRLKNGLPSPVFEIKKHTDKAKQMGLRFLIILNVRGDWARSGWLDTTEGIPRLAAPTITGYEHGERSSRIDATIYDLSLDRETDISVEVKKPYSITGLVIFPIYNVPNVEVEACENIGAEVGAALRDIIASEQ